MASFKIYKIAEAGGEVTISIPVVFPGVDATGETINIRSIYSQAFRDAQAAMSRQIQTLRIANKGAPLDEETISELEVNAFASLVESWTFDEPCVAANVADFLRDNPQMKDIISVRSAKDSLFFKKEEQK